MTRYKYLIIILILFTAYNSFFINKALHIDDSFTVSVAREVNTNFLKPSLVFFSNPPFLGYYYAPIIKIFGENEIWLHIFYFIFSWSAIISMFFLCKRFSRGSLIPLLFLICTPAFIISSHGIMLDIPLLGFFLASIATFVYGVDRDNKILLIISGLLTAAAILTKYSGLVLIPILFIYALLNTSKKKASYLFIPIFMFLLWNLYCLLFYNYAIFFYALRSKLSHYFFDGIGIRMLASLSFLAGTSIVALFLTPLLLNKKKDMAYFSISLIAGALPFMIKGVFSEYSIFEKIVLSVLFISSTYIILLIVRGRGDKDSRFLSSWFVLMFIFVLFTNFIAARFLLLLMPPMFLLIYNHLPMASKNKIRSAILICFIFSTVLAIGDYQAADVYRDFIYSLGKGEGPYFLRGNSYDSWGYAYYSRKRHDLSEVDSDARKIPGDIFITPTEPVLPIAIERKADFDKFLDARYKKTLIDRVFYRGHIFLHHRRLKAGFYSHDWGLLPFSFSVKKSSLEVFEIYRLGDKDES